MKNNTKYMLCMVAFLIISSGMIFMNVDSENKSDNAAATATATINVRIEKDSNDIWRVRDLNGTSRGTLNATSNDQVQWQNRSGGEVIFTFSEDVERYFEFDGGLFMDGRSQSVRRNGNLSLTIKDTAPRGILIYEVYVRNEDAFVQGNSAPRMIIQ